MALLTGKTAMITGGTSGIGFAIAKLFAAEGAQVIVSGRREDAAKEAVRQIGAQAVYILGDVADPEFHARAADEIADRFGAPDIYVANAGINTIRHSGAVPEAEYDAQFATNTRGVFIGVQKIAPILRDRAAIVITGSLASERVLDGHAVYAGSKAAIGAFARSWALELKDRGIRVNVLSPGPTDTEILGKLGVTPEQRPAFEAQEPQSDIGWGRVRDDIEEIAVCPDGSVRVVYQGELTASKYLRAAIPLPDDDLKGKVKIKATLCYTTEIDSAHPGTYTRSGLEVFFRPHDERFDPKATHPKTDGFFSPSKLYDHTEESLRRGAHKWETCLNGEVSKLGKSLKDPVFDIHYVARDEGHVERQGLKIKYALVITIEAPRHADLYDMIVRKYRNILEPMLPLQVPVQVQQG